MCIVSLILLVRPLQIMTKSLPAELIKCVTRLCHSDTKAITDRE